MKNLNWTAIITTSIVALAVVLASGILGGSAVKTKTAVEVVKVTGSAQMPITSDLIIWTGTVSFQGPDLATSYKGLKQSTATVIAYLEKQGVKKDEISTNSIVSNPLFQPLAKTTADGGTGTTFRPIVAYQLTQVVKVRSSNITLVDSVSREVTDLLSSGVIFQSDPPQYLYTKIGEAKIEILSKAAADARNRAEQLAKSAGATLGAVRYIHMSPLQITPRDSTDISSDGQNDTTSLDKTITAIVQLGISVRD